MLQTLPAIFLLASEAFASLGPNWHGGKSVHRRHSSIAHSAASRKTFESSSSENTAIPADHTVTSTSWLIADPAREEAILFAREEVPATVLLQNANQPGAPITPAPAPQPPSSTQPSLMPIVVGPPHHQTTAQQAPPQETKQQQAVTQQQSSPGPPASNPSTKRPMVGGYYTSWTAEEFPPEQLDFSRYDWIDYAFSVPDGNSGLRFIKQSEEDVLARLVKAAHEHRKRVKLSIGGWADSKDFSPMVSSEDTRKAFALRIAEIFKKFNLDGIDIDWEYPGEGGAEGNRRSPEDTDNLLDFLTKLRATLPPNALITAACQDWPFAGNDGIPLKDVSGFAKVLDWVLLMNYDIYSGSSTPGPNAPLANACGNSTVPKANAISAVKSWVDAGFPASQLVLGLPSYGYIFDSLPSPSGTERHKRDNEGGSNFRLRSGGEDGNIVQFYDIVRQGALQPDSRGKFTGGKGFERNWDGCSGTPFLRSTFSHQVVTYDDPDSLQLKAEFAFKAGLCGVSIFDAHGDTSDSQLLDGIRRGLGIIKS